MNNPVLSVVMGVYNCPTEEMLMTAVNSVLEQTFTDFEFIICDDGSDNDTYLWLEKAASLDDRIILIRNRKNMSLAYSLNRCIEAARGKYIARQDVDDYSSPERFSVQVAYLDSHPDMYMVGSDCMLYDESGVYGKRHMPHHPKKLDFLFNSPFVHGTVIMRREVFEKAGFYRPCGYTRKYEDYDLFMRIYKLEMKGANINTPLYSFHSDKKRRVSRLMRIDETVVRYNGFKSLGLLPKGFIYVLKPVFMITIPNRIINSLKRSYASRN